MTSAYKITASDLRFLLLTIALIFLAHAAAYFSHEYAHAVTAWALGWMRSPIDIDYGRLSLSNVLFQQDVGDGVDYAPIFASRHGVQAALIAFDGPGIGNGLLYVICFLALRSTYVMSRRTPAMFLFWVAVMGAGNVWSYAPMRTVTTHADMALVARGLGISTWLLLPLVTAPSLLILWNFFARLLPMMRRTVFAGSPVTDAFPALMACTLIFVFFGDGGLDNAYGEVSAVLSIASVFVVFPLAAVFALFATPPAAGSGPTARPPPAAGRRRWPGPDRPHSANRSG